MYAYFGSQRAENYGENKRKISFARKNTQIVFQADWQKNRRIVFVVSALLHRLRQKHNGRKNVFINSGCCFQDQGGITIGDGALIGHQVVLATLNHDLNPERRKSMKAAPIVIGKNVWIGAHATVLAGVSIGDNAVIAIGLLRYELWS